MANNEMHRLCIHIDYLFIAFRKLNIGIPYKYNAYDLLKNFIDRYEEK